MLKHAGMPNKLSAEAVCIAVYIKDPLPSRAVPNSTPFERWTRKKPDISHVRTFGCLAFTWIHANLRKKLDNHAYQCVFLGYLVETSTQYRVLDGSSGRVFITRDVKFVESTLYCQLIKTQPIDFALEPAEQDKDSEIEDEAPKPLKATVQSPKAMIQSQKAMVQPQKATALPRAINPIDNSDDDLTPPPETPPPKLRMTGRTAANIRIAMMIGQGPKTYCAALDAKDSEQWKEAISKEVASMESNEVFTFIE